MVRLGADEGFKRSGRRCLMKRASGVDGFVGLSTRSWELVAEFTGP